MQLSCLSVYAPESRGHSRSTCKRGTDRYLMAQVGGGTPSPRAGHQSGACSSWREKCSPAPRAPREARGMRGAWTGVPQCRAAGSWHSPSDLLAFNPARSKHSPSGLLTSSSELSASPRELLASPGKRTCAGSSLWSAASVAFGPTAAVCAPASSSSCVHPPPPLPQPQHGSGALSPLHDSAGSSDQLHVS
jgi:hypothetical protein